MTALPRISIILPTYNGSRYIAHAIDSCLEQTYKNWELVIVDDASTDNTPDIISDYVERDMRIRSIRHDTNRKLPAALNTGFAVAQGDFMTWLSDDNAFKSIALDVMASYLDKNADVDIVYSDYIVIDENGHFLERITVPSWENIVRENVVQASFMYRRDVHLSLGGYNEELFLVEDYEFWLRAAARFRMAPLHQVLYEYRSHDKSLSFNNSRLVKKRYRYALRHNIDALEWLGAREKAVICINLAAFAREDNDYAESRAFVRKALLASPLIVLLVMVKMLLLGRKISYERPIVLPKWLH